MDEPELLVNRLVGILKAPVSEEGILEIILISKELGGLLAKATKPPIVIDTWENIFGSSNITNSVLAVDVIEMLLFPCIEKYNLNTLFFKYWFNMFNGTLKKKTMVKHYGDFSFEIKENCLRIDKIKHVPYILNGCRIYRTRDASGAYGGGLLTYYHHPANDVTRIGIGIGVPVKYQYAAPFFIYMFSCIAKSIEQSKEVSLEATPNPTTDPTAPR